MNKIILILLLLTGTAMSQYSLKIRLVTSSGTPNPGQASNISFCRYPHSDAVTDAVSGITVFETGTAGNYVAYGFTTYEHVTLWLSGVKQVAFDSTQVGSLPTYLSTNYILKAGSVTGITGNKTISSGDWLKLGGTETWYKPYVYSSSPWYTDYSLLSGGSLVFKNYGDSIYGIKPGYYDGSNFRLNTSTTLLGRTSTTSPIGVNTYDFNYSGDQLSLDYDGSLSDSLRVRKDTIISENTYSKWWVLKRRFWSQYDSLRILWYYRNSYTNTVDSFQAINNVISNDNSNVITLGTSATKLDSIYLSPGLYTIDYGINYHFGDASLGSAPTIQPDSIGINLFKGESALSGYVYAVQQYFDGVNYGRMGTLSWSVSVSITASAYIYLKGIRQNTETALGHTTRRSYIIATLVK